MARRPTPGRPGDDYEPDWTEEELEEKLNALRARDGRKSERREQDLRRHGINLNHTPQYENDDEGDFEPPDDDEEEDLSLKAMKRADSLIDAGEFAELEQLAKVQVVMDPQQAKFWRKLVKLAGKRRRAQKPRIVRFFMSVLRIGLWFFAALLVVSVLGVILQHH